MTSQESVIARDSMGFEDIDEFWDTVGTSERPYSFIVTTEVLSLLEDDQR